MEVKKNPEKDVSYKRFDFTLVGMVVALSLVLVAFVYRTPPEPELVLEGPEINEELTIMENTVQEKKPPPPPPPPELEVVEDDTEIEEEQPEFEDTETDQDEAMEQYEEEEEEPEETNEVFEMFAVQVPATFKDGGENGLRKFLHENIVYPESAKAAEVQGTVVVRFVVDKYGNISNLEILTPVKGFGLEDEAKRVLKLTSGMWSPARQRDQAVSVRYQIPVNFQLY